MSFANTNDYLTGRKPAPFPAGGEVVAVRYTLALGTADLDLNDAGSVGFLPAGCVPVDVHVDGTDMDTGAAALVFQVGIANATDDNISTAAADGGAHWGVTTAANAAFHQRLTFNGQAMVSVQAAQVDRKIGLKVATAPTTPASGTVGVTVFYRAV
jgi:hypothetical protein